VLEISEECKKEAQEFLDEFEPILKHATEPWKQNIYKQVKALAEAE